MRLHSVAILLVCVTAIGCLHVPKSEASEHLAPMGAKAPTYNPSAGANALPEFVVGRWKQLQKQRPGLQGLQDDLGSYGPYLLLEKDGTASWVVGNHTAIGQWAVNGQSIALRFTQFDLGSGSHSESSRNLFESSASLIDAVRVDEDRQHLILDHPDNPDSPRFERLAETK